MPLKRILSLSLALLALSACNLPLETPVTPPASSPTGIPPVSSPTFEAEPPTPTTEPAGQEFTGEAMGVFRVAILVDLTSEPVAQEAALAVLQEASSILQYQTGYELEVIDFHEMERVGTINQMAFTYLNTLAPETPNGLVIFSYGDDDLARLYGGYSGWVVGPQGYRNTFVSPVAGDQHVYLAVMHWSERYGECGYGGTDEITSTTSIGGECRNQPGTSCVQKHGYQMCANVIDSLYASSPTYFIAASIVHEFMHPFGTGTGDDHYGSPKCKQDMGWTEGNWTFRVEESERYNVICPRIYAIFTGDLQP